MTAISIAWIWSLANERSSRDVVALVDVAGLRARDPVEGRDGRATQAREGAEDKKKALNFH